MRNTGRSRRRAFLPVLAFALLLTRPDGVLGQGQRDRFPEDGWMRYTDVADAGFDAAKLEAARQTWEAMPSSAFLVIADGAVVAAWGEVERRFMCHSVRKSFLSGLYGIFWDRGEIELNKTLADLGIDDDPDPLLETEKRARILDLLKARSGVFHPAAYAGRTDSRPRGSEGPGRYFAYNNWDFNTSAAILMQETGVDVFEGFDQYFAQPLRMEDWRVSDGYYHYERDKSKYPAYPFRMSARDAARFGLLYAREGLWGDQRILSEQWVRRSSALYSIDTDVMGYGLYWWILREPRFTRHGMYAALGVGNQMIAVLPKSDMVIVNRANTYEGESTPMPALLDLIDQVLDARTGTPVSEPSLTPLEEEPVPNATRVAEERLQEFLGEWTFPPAPLGFPASTTVRITAGPGHLVSYSPVAGTFSLYLQADGSLREEDSYERYVPVRDDAGVLSGIADVRTVLAAALIAAADHDEDRASDRLAMVQGLRDLQVDVSGLVTEFLAGSDPSGVEGQLREVSARADKDSVEETLGAAGLALLQAEKVDAALETLDLSTRLFPDSFRAWDTLGRALMAAGNSEGALRAFERSLELNPDNANAERMINRIRGGGALQPV